MKSWRVAAVLSFLTTIHLTNPALSDDDEVRLFIPANEGAQVVNATTGAIGDVVRSLGADMPADCPTNGYWVSGGVMVVSCDDGVRYRLVPFDASENSPLATMRLEPVSANPKPGTDDPGPMRGPDLELEGYE